METRRFFSKRQRVLLRLISGGLCTFCKQSVGKKFDADHIKPFSRGGLTILKNAQALCASCNRKKGAKYES